LLSFHHRCLSFAPGTLPEASGAREVLERPSGTAELEPSPSGAAELLRRTTSAKEGLKSNHSGSSSAATPRWKEGEKGEA
jgi:hypothetical protein